MGNIGGEGSLGYWICKIRMVHVPGEDDDDVYVCNFVTGGELEFPLGIIAQFSARSVLFGGNVNGWLAESSLEIP